MALGTIHVLAEGRPSTTLVMCPSHITHKWARETGLDLLAFPTLYFYETGYSLHTLRQASRRSWRIGQRHPVRVKFVTYSGTMQETCLRLMGKKGKFSGEGLRALDTDEDLMSAMARELVEKAGVGESADAVWRELGDERERVLPRPAEAEPELQSESVPDLDLPTATPAPLAPTTFGISLLEPVPQPKSGRRPRLGRPLEKQMCSSVSSTELHAFHLKGEIFCQVRSRLDRVLCDG